MALLKLRLALTEKAEPYGMGTDIDGIFASLRARFGTSAMDTEPSTAPAPCGPMKKPRRRTRPKPRRRGPPRDRLDELPTSETARKTKTPYEAPSSPPQLVHSHPLTGEKPIAHTCTMTAHSRGTIHRKVNGAHTCSSNQLTRSGKTSVPCLQPPSETVNLLPPTLSYTPFVQEGDSRLSGETAVRSPQESPSLGRRTVSPHTPHNKGNRGKPPDGCVDNGKRQETATLLHQTEAVSHLGNPNSQLHVSCCPGEAPLVAESAPLHRALPHRGLPQSNLGNRGQPHLPIGLTCPRRHHRTSALNLLQPMASRGYNTFRKIFRGW